MPGKTIKLDVDMQVSLSSSYAHLPYGLYEICSSYTSEVNLCLVIGIWPFGYPFVLTSLGFRKLKRKGASITYALLL